MTIIPHDEVEQIVPIIDDLLKTGYSHPVSYFKEKYHLTNDEYTMIFDLTMPFIRLRNEALFWRNRYAMMRNHIFHIMPNSEEEETDLTKKIRRILKEEYEITSEREMQEEDDESDED